MRNETTNEPTSLLQKLAGCLGQLSEGERLILALHYFEKLSWQEIASVTDSSENAVRRLHGLALDKLRGRLPRLPTGLGAAPEPA